MAGRLATEPVEGHVFEIYAAQGKLSDKLFRIFHMGEYPLEVYQIFLRALGRVVAPEEWQAKVGATLLAEACRIAPTGLDLHVNADNARAIAFYRKHGFVVSGEDVNARSGAPVLKMSWRP